MLKKVLAMAGALTMVFASIGTTVFAADSYNLTIPSPYVGSLQSTELLEKERGTSPYVDPSKNTLVTKYFLSPEPGSSVTATNIVTTSTTAKKSFTYESGYGGVGTDYCLSAYPGVTGSYDEYVVSGTWSR